MAIVMYADRTACAIWTKPLSGDPMDPFYHPEDHLDLVIFHSDFDYYGVVAKDLSKVINHASVAGKTASINIGGGGTGAGVVTYTVNGDQVAADHLLLTHNLGYVPRFFVAYAGQMIPTGVTIQRDDAHRVRFVCAYATTAEIRLWELGISSASTLASASRTYGVIVFRDPADDPLTPQLQMKAGDVIFGKGKFRSAESLMRNLASGDSPFDIAVGPTVDIKNGGLRIVTPDGTVYDTGSYNGSFSGPATIPVGF